MKKVIAVCTLLVFLPTAGHAASEQAAPANTHTRVEGMSGPEKNTGGSKKESAREDAREEAREMARARAIEKAKVREEARARAYEKDKGEKAKAREEAPALGQIPERPSARTLEPLREAGRQKAISVHDSVRRALNYSPQVQQAQESRQQATHEVRRAEAGFYPTIGVWAGVGANQSDDTSTRASKEEDKTVATGTTGLKFSQSVWQGGSTSALVRSRSATLEAQTYMVTDSATLIAFNAISSHTDVIRRRVLLQLSRKNVEEHKYILQLLRARYDQGIASQGEVDQVQGRLSRAEATELGHKMGMQAALANYERLTGQPAPRELSDTAMPALVYARLDEVRDDSVQYNPRLQAELANIKSALGEQDYVRGNFSPRVSVDGGPTYTDWGRKGDTHQWTWNAMLNINWDLFSGGADVAAYRSAAAKTRQLRKALHAYMDLLDEEIRVTWSRCFELRDQSRHYAKAKEASHRARENFFEQFLAGQRGLLDVLDAESEYFYASVEECIAATDSVLGFYRLLALSGRLLPVLGVHAPAAPQPAAAQEAPWDFLGAPSTLDRGEAMKGSTLRDVSTGQ